MIQKSQFTEALCLLFYAGIMPHKPISQYSSVTMYLKKKLDLAKCLCLSHIYNVLCITGTVALHLKGQFCGVLSTKSHKALSLYIINIGWYNSHSIKKDFFYSCKQWPQCQKSQNWIKTTKIKEKNNCSITASVNASIKVNGVERLLFLTDCWIESAIHWPEHEGFSHL